WSSLYRCFHRFRRAGSECLETGGKNPNETGQQSSVHRSRKPALQGNFAFEKRSDLFPRSSERKGKPRISAECRRAQGQVYGLCTPDSQRKRDKACLG